MTSSPNHASLGEGTLVGGETSFVQRQLLPYMIRLDKVLIQLSLVTAGRAESIKKEAVTAVRSTTEQGTTGRIKAEPGRQGKRKRGKLGAKRSRQAHHRAVY